MAPDKVPSNPKLFDVKKSFQIVVDDAVAFRIVDLQSYIDVEENGNDNDMQGTENQTPEAAALQQKILENGGVVVGHDVDDYDFDITLVLLSSNTNSNKHGLNTYLISLCKTGKLRDLFRADFVEDCIKHGNRSDLNPYKLTSNFKDYDANDVLNIRTKWSDLKPKTLKSTEAAITNNRIGGVSGDNIQTKHKQAQIGTSERASTSTRTNVHKSPQPPPKAQSIPNPNTSAEADCGRRREEVVASPVSSFHDGSSEDDESNFSFDVQLYSDEERDSIEFTRGRPRAGRAPVRTAGSDATDGCNRRNSQRCMTHEEMQTVLNYVCSHNLISFVGGNSMWKAMVLLKIIPGRSFGTLMNNFHKSILPLGKLEKFETTNADYSRLCFKRRRTQK